MHRIRIAFRREGNTGLGGVRRQFADDRAAFSSRCARNPADRESPAIGELHRAGAVAASSVSSNPALSKSSNNHA